MLKINCVLRQVAIVGMDLKAQLACHYRSPHVRCVVRTRVLCQAGRCHPADTMRERDDVLVWLMMRAPLWVVACVCRLLRDAE